MFGEQEAVSRSVTHRSGIKQELGVANGIERARPRGYIEHLGQTAWDGVDDMLPFRLLNGGTPFLPSQCQQRSSRLGLESG